VSLPSLWRWCGLAAVVAGVLFITSDLAILLPARLGQEAFEGGTPLRSIVALTGVALLLLGLVGLYSPHSEAMGILGLVAFLAAFVGLVIQRDTIWGSLIVNLGWALFGAACLAARVYPRTAAILLVICATLSMVVNTLLASSLLLPDLLGYTAVIIDIIFEVAIAWLGLSLFMRRNKGVVRRDV